MGAIRSALWKSLRSYQVYGANTNVGKTIISTALCKSLQRKFPDERIWYLKPVSTGPLAEADDCHVRTFVSGIQAGCLFQFDEPVSPHIAARQSIGNIPSDSELVQSIYSKMSQYAAESTPGWALVETAGGVHSPGPSGTPQADLYRPLRLSTILVADSNLGGISSSISAFESLHVRGYDVDLVVLFANDRYQNHEYLVQYFAPKNVTVLPVPAPPERQPDETSDRQCMADYYDSLSESASMDQALGCLTTSHDDRIRDLNSMASRANRVIWYPFSQHQSISPSTITTIDSAYGDYFHTLDPAAKEDTQRPLLNATIDGSASWWTQGLGHGNPELSLAASYAAGRYGHVMFAGTVHEPALMLAESLLANLRNSRLARVFYSDNGSTGIEVAVKMALRAAAVRNGWDSSVKDVEVMGLRGSYHGDTIGSMDCSEPSVYNEKVGWYRGRGYWFEYPTVKMVNGMWTVEVPESLQRELGPGSQHASISAVFNLSRRQSELSAQRYRAYIQKIIHKLVIDDKRRFGALIMEPVILGAGGMILIDPLFQKLLVDVVRESRDIFEAGRVGNSQQAAASDWTGLPVIFDEVFTGLYRLGRFSSSSFIGVEPDISVHAKLLTGGVVPLCATLASESIFEAFVSPDKSDALLHGHSYTAHAIGCTVARTSISSMIDMERHGSWDNFKVSWQDSDGPEIWSTWSKEFIAQLSTDPCVAGAIGLGSVLAITLKDSAGSGYTSTVSQDLQARLAQTSGRDWNIHSRVLGNVIYLMTSLTCATEDVRAVEKFVASCLQR
ncbi:pyridoxal phosphate-dependent transferase [Lipomyces orientalis]|uniref:Pyridoxal phosphate-dependent transferase n=1 Tax=Lipomyces orientalis TaxID=1233043 RepID=A0ACC3THG7_9ASCO